MTDKEFQMFHDKYRNWPLPANRAPVLSCTDLKTQLLQDLAATDDQIEQLEILDSYEAWAKRAYAQEVAQALSLTFSKTLGSLMAGGILSQLPPVYVLSRGRPGEIYK